MNESELIKCRADTNAELLKVVIIINKKDTNKKHAIASNSAKSVSNSNSINARLNSSSNFTQ